MSPRFYRYITATFPGLYWRLKNLYRSLGGSSPAKAHTCLPEGQSVEDFFDGLNSKQIRYAFLRWHESLPDNETGRELPLLVDDEHAEHVRGMLVKSSKGRPCRVYSVSGLPGSTFKKLPLYPPGLARMILDEAKLMDQRYRIPSERHSFLTLAYHCVYHLGYRSGIPSRSDVAQLQANNRDVQPDERQGISANSEKTDSRPLPYLTRLKEMAGGLRIDCEWTLEGLDAYLQRSGWQPAKDKLSRYVRHNAWIHDHFFRSDKPLPESEKKMACFIFRDRVADAGLTETFEQIIRKEGFDILASSPLTGERKERVRQNVRGGNWGRGDWPSSGGDPSHAVFVRDPDPATVPSWLTVKYPLLDNYRIYLIKNKLRKHFNSLLEEEQQHCSSVHVSDNAREAWEYIAHAAPDRIEQVKNKLRETAEM